MKDIGWIIKFVLIVAVIFLAFGLISDLLPDISKLFAKKALDDVGKGAGAASAGAFEGIQSTAGGLVEGYMDSVKKNGPGLIPTVPLFQKWVIDPLRDVFNPSSQSEQGTAAPGSFQPAVPGSSESDYSSLLGDWRGW